MKRSKFLPIAAFIIGIAAAFVSHARVQQTTWVYQDNNERTENPDCIAAQPVCAVEFNLNSDGSLGAPTGNKMHGIRQP